MTLEHNQLQVLYTMIKTLPIAVCIQYPLFTVLSNIPGELTLQKNKVISCGSFVLCSKHDVIGGVRG